MIRRVAIALLFAVLCVRLWNDAYHFARCSFTLDTIAECRATGELASISAEVICDNCDVGTPVYVAAGTAAMSVPTISTCLSVCK